MFFRKMLRDLYERKGAYIACTVIIIIGLMIFVSFSILSKTMHISQEQFYKNQNFADGFIDIQSIPKNQVEKYKAIQGISDIQGRLVKDVPVFFQGSTENTYLRLVSIDLNKADIIDNTILEKGNGVENSKLNILTDNQFFDANNLSLNQPISVIIQGKVKELSIVGVGKNPEFVYALRNPSDLYPNNKTFGIAFIPYDTLVALFGEGEICNSLVFTLAPGAQYKDVEDILKRELKKYGLKAIYPRKDQVSNMIITQKLQGIDGEAKSLPILFLSISGAILYIMLKRLVEVQRGQIGTLKAFGYTNFEIMLHYLSYALTIGLIGGVVGGLLGIWLSGPFIDLFKAFFNMPMVKGSFSISYFVTGIILSLVFAVFAGYQGCKNTLKLEPAEAMRPPSPPSGKKTFIERAPVVWNQFTVQGKMAIRNMFREYGRSLFMFFGIISTFILLILPWSAKGLVDKMIFDQFSKVAVYDVKISFLKPQNQSAVENELIKQQGVYKVESELEIPVSLENQWYKKDVAVIGIEQNSQLYNILDKNNNKVTAPKNGILLSERLAGLLNIKTGETIDISSQFMKEPDTSKKVEVVGIIPQYLGLNAYMDIGALQTLLEQGNIVTSAILKIDKNYIEDLNKKYENLSGVGSIADSSQAKKQVEDLMATYSSLYYVLALMGMITGFAIIYSSSITTLSERSRDLATMMVLGMHPKEVLSVVTFEQWSISVAAMIFGIPLSKYMLVALSAAVSTDVYVLPTSLTFESIVIAFITTVVSIWFAQTVVGRKIKHFDIVEVLKSRD